MGVIARLRCPKCRHEPASRTVFQCPQCRSVLEVNIEIGHLQPADFDRMRQSRDLSIWRWFDFFPVNDRSSIVSLGEGNTPLIHARRLGDKIGITNLYLKNDTVLPTGSLKDRSNSVGLSVARELGFKTAAVMSTGNAAASVAAYSAAAGIESVVLVTKGTAPSKIIQARAYGATVIVVDGDFDYEVAKLYKAAIQEFGWYDCLSSNPYRDEGKKSYAYEMVDQFDGRIPDWVIHPTAGGTGIYAMWKGYKEFLSLGWIDRAPKLVAAQSEAAAPIVAAFEKGLSDVEPVTARETVAESIQVGNPTSLGWRALAALRESGGTAVAVRDDEILEAQALTGSLAGIFAEPAAATSVAAAKKLRDAGIISRADTVVCNLTGHGLKQPEAVHFSEKEFAPIPPTLDALRGCLQRAKR
ncbi:MAG TPA: threonine synthase [Candidatus Saccharimonadales bacterium]|nr:threonine synthase [Candidatus Saccharimonadales bacterium]